jgi:adenosine deaminase
LAHAGEEGDASYVREALDRLKIVRIDHGNNALQDRQLVEEIIKRDMAMTVCPLSNLALQVVKDIHKHPLKKMLDLGLKPTINSDDPAYFGGYINRNFLVVTEALSLTREDLYRLAYNSFKYSLLDENKKAAFIKRLDEYMNF